VDRVRCSAHGICAQVLAGKVTLDEWGYPVLVDPHLDEEEFRTASTLCPALALYRD
jgi:ferredoxin